MFKAVLWDFGGVITSSPFEAFNRFEESNNLPKDFIRSINATNPETNAWAQLESSQISVEEFDDIFAQEATDKGHEVRGRQVLNLLSGDIRPEMVSALHLIKQSHQIGCITNNVNTGEGPGMARSEKKATAIADVMSLFDVVIESSKIGIRKPDPRIYQMTCEQMSISPDETVYLDDLGVNLKPARALGMTTI
ncbi:MAG: HAD-IA family hydrolase, partial [Gammaproteobacteria bacterium]|nr:HAD-IA family hydrolase [Gammaproteobacteria bacterium]